MSLQINLDSIRLGESAEADAYVNWISSAPHSLFTEYNAYFGQLGNSTPFFCVPKIDWYTVNRVMGFGIFEEARTSMLGELLRVCKERSVRRIFVSVYPESNPPPAIIRGWLREFGFEKHNSWVKLSRGNEVSKSEAKSEFEIRKIGREHAKDFAKTVTDGFKYPREFERWLEFVVGRPGWHNYLAFSGKDQPVASGALFTKGRVGYLGLGSTLDGFRHQGAQASLIQRRVVDGIEMGCEIFFTETTPDLPQKPTESFRNMIRAGFRVEYERENYVLKF
jgi:hypothetical protein